MATGVALVTAGTGTASPATAPAQNNSAAPATALACPPEGTRFKVPGHGDTVFLIGPKGWQYQFLGVDQYSALWRTWDGIQFGWEGCLTNPDVMFDVRLVQEPNNPTVYIYDASFDPGCYRPIVDWNSFTNKYHFDPEKIEVDQIPFDHTCTQHPWT
jgi:hypothetical protein